MKNHIHTHKHRDGERERDYPAKGINIQSISKQISNIIPQIFLRCISLLLYDLDSSPYELNVRLAIIFHGKTKINERNQIRKRAQKYRETDGKRKTSQKQYSQITIKTDLTIWRKTCFSSAHQTFLFIGGLFSLSSVCSSNGEEN